MSRLENPKPVPDGCGILMTTDDPEHQDDEDEPQDDTDSAGAEAGGTDDEGAAVRRGQPIGGLLPEIYDPLGPLRAQLAARVSAPADPWWTLRVQHAKLYPAKDRIA
ncbi:hypothetical protein OHV05_34610 [Kitasatospora sp. NBC_00070]|uniref:hypothetical protein n=1 Tax=Kitasatospora sp. NBC_00070 TaxID=2975962 RepID=UPI0032557499